MFPALGFGAKLPNGVVSHEFFLVSFAFSVYEDGYKTLVLYSLFVALSDNQYF